MIDMLLQVEASVHAEKNIPHAATKITESHEDTIPEDWQSDEIHQASTASVQEDDGFPLYAQVNKKRNPDYLPQYSSAMDVSPVPHPQASDCQMYDSFMY